MMALEKIDVAMYPDFSRGIGDRESLLRAIDESLAYYRKPSSKRYFPYLDVSHERAARSLEEFRRLVATGVDGSALQREIVDRFDVYRSVGCDWEGTVLFTGYYTPIFEGSMTPDSVYRYPLYRLPEDLVKDPEGHPLGKKTDRGVVPYDTREAIERDRLLAGRGLELVWLKDRFEVYVVHVQGSARIRLRDGREMQVGYAGKTDRPYRSVGEALTQDGKLRKDDLSLFTMREYFARHPEDLDHYLALNESYVFFTEHQDGPFGSLNAKVSPMRTIATDKIVFPRGALAFVETNLPTQGGFGERPYQGFVLDQDTGGAIRSAGRCDLYIGVGAEAERLAGRTRAEGRLYYLFLREDEMIPRTPPQP